MHRVSWYNIYNPPSVTLCCHQHKASLLCNHSCKPFDFVNNIEAIDMTRALVVSFLVMLLASPTVFGTDYTVGDSAGWAQGNDYSTWASGKTFKVGDNLVFKYDSTHQVDVVDENGYKSCSTSNVLKNYNDGNTKIPLSTTGKTYFICPTPGHCSGGMKLEVNVVAASNTPSEGSPPTTPSDTPPSTTPSTTASPPPPKSNGAISVSSGISHLMGSLFVAGIILGFMG